MDASPLEELCAGYSVLLLKNNRGGNVSHHMCVWRTVCGPDILRSARLVPVISASDKTRCLRGSVEVTYGSTVLAISGAPISCVNTKTDISRDFYLRSDFVYTCTFSSPDTCERVDECCEYTVYAPSPEHS